MSVTRTLTNASRPDRKPRVVHSESHWRQLIAQYDTGSLTQKCFCQQHQISVSSLHKWRNRFKQDEDTSHFIDISKAIVPTQHKSDPAVAPESPVWQVELEPGHGMVLRVRSL